MTLRVINGCVCDAWRVQQSFKWSYRWWSKAMVDFLTGAWFPVLHKESKIVFSAPLSCWLGGFKARFGFPFCWHTTSSWFGLPHVPHVSRMQGISIFWLGHNAHGHITTVVACVTLVC